MASSSPNSPAHSRSLAEQASSLSNAGDLGRNQSTQATQADELQDQTRYLPRKQVILVFSAVGASLFVALLDSSIVATAVDTIASDIGNGELSSWVGTAYLATSASFQPLWGRISDIFGRKPALLASMAVFLIGTVLCASAKTMLQLVVYRGVQGVGGAGMGVLAFITISDVVSLRERGKYEGILAAVRVLGTSLGPLLGGGLSSVWWPLVFIIVIPLVMGSAALVAWQLPLKPVHGSMVEKAKRVDYLGALLSFSATILLLIGLNWGSTQYGWGDVHVVATLCTGSALIAIFCIVEGTLVKYPVVPMRLLFNPTVFAATLQAWANGATQFGVVFFIAQWAQTSKGTSSLVAGAILIPFGIAQCLFAPLAGYFVSRTNQYKIVMLLGYAIYSVDLGLLAYYTGRMGTPLAVVIGLTTLGGFASSGTQQVSLVALQNFVSRADMSVGTALRDFARVTGGAFGISIGFALVNTQVRSLEAQLPPGTASHIVSTPSALGAGSLGLDPSQTNVVMAAFARGYAQSFYFLAGASTMAFFCVLFGVKQVSLDRSDDEQRQREGKHYMNERSRTIHLS